MREYAAYKDLGVEWIGEIPVHWDFLRMKNAFTFGKGLNITKADLVDEGIPVVSYGQIHSKNNTGVHISKDLIRYVDESHLNSGKRSLVFVGDILFADTSEDYNGVGNCLFVDYKGNIFAGYHTLIARPINLKDPKYMAYLFQDEGWRKQVRSEVMGIKVFSLTQRILKNVQILIPPEDERKKIITYLDIGLCQVDSLIAGNENQLSMLTRYKRDLIAECVTKGLNKDAPMRPSGEDWIGDVPEHWQIIPLRAFLKPNNRKNPGGLLLLSVERERGVVNRETDGSPDNYNRIPDDLSNYKMVDEGQFVMNKMKAWQGSYGVAPCAGIVSPAYYVYDLAFENKVFFNYAIRSKCYVGFFGQDSYGIRMDQWDFKAECIKHIPFVVPPIEEQQEIVNYLSKQESKINRLQANIEAQIQKLKDYRRILIHDAVTGKIKI